HRPDSTRAASEQEVAAADAARTRTVAPHRRTNHPPRKGDRKHTSMNDATPPLVHAAVPVTANDLLARNTYRLRLHAPELARTIRPGQFVMLRLPGTTDPLLGRPFALYDTVLAEGGEPVGIDIVHLVVGKMTGLLAGLRSGDRVEVWGPLG